MRGRVIPVNGPDSPNKLLARFFTQSERFELPEREGDLIYGTWLELGSPPGLCMVSAPSMNRAPAGYLHVWVEDGALSWYNDPVTKQIADGVSPYDMRTEVYDRLARRGVTVDTANANTLFDICKRIANEIKHAAGLGRTYETRNEPDEPGWQRKFAAGLIQCSAAARRHRVD